MWCKIHENVLQDQKNVLQDQKNVLQDYRKCAAESFWKTGVGFLLKLNPTANSLFSIELYFWIQLQSVISRRCQKVSNSIELYCSIVWIFGSPQSKTILKSILVYIAIETTVLKPKEVLHVHVHAPLYQWNCIEEGGGDRFCAQLKGKKIKCIVNCRTKRTATMYNVKKIFINSMTISVFSYV